MERFLACHPNVFAIHREYQIVVNVRGTGICRLFVAGKEVYESGSGVYATERKVHKFSLPQKLLDDAGEYTLSYRRVEQRKAYGTVPGEEERATYLFYPLKKEENIRGVYLADVHGNYNPSNYPQAERAAAAFGAADFYIVNGDIGEIETDEMLVEINAFIGRISGGVRPVVVGRGNHDTRGRLAERMPDHLATDGEKTYFSFTLGPISGVVVDCGEDKLDNNVEYGGLNWFEEFRRREARNLSLMRLPDSKYKIAISHIPFMSNDSMKSCFDIMPETYAVFGRAINRMAPDFMLCGHSHHFEYYPVGDEGGKFYHNYPVVGASRMNGEGFGCTGFILHTGRAEFVRIGSDGKEVERFMLPLRH